MADNAPLEWTDIEKRLPELTDADLEATHLLLGERAHQITLAQEKVRDEQARRRSTIDSDKHEAWNGDGKYALADAIVHAPQRAAELAEQRAARQATIDEALTKVPTEYRDQIADQLGSVVGDLTPEIVTRVLAQFTPPSPEDALAAYSDDDLLSVIKSRGISVQTEAS